MPIIGARGADSVYSYGRNGASAPGSPTIGTLAVVSSIAYGSNPQYTISFTAPTNTGGLAITGYQYSTDGGTTYATASGTTSPITLTTQSTGGTPAFAAGTSYSVILKAVNSAGAGQPSGASNSVTALTLPQAPTIGTLSNVTGIAYGSNPQYTIAFTAGATGGSAITGYQYSTNAGTNWASTSGTTSPQTLTLQSTGAAFVAGTSYSVIVRSVTAYGNSLASGSASATYAAATIPQTPTISTIGVNSSTNVTLNWSGANGGIAPTSVTVGISPSISLTYSGTSTALSVTGSYVQAISYTFTISQTNPMGTSGTSAGVASTPNPLITGLYITNAANITGLGAIGGWFNKSVTKLRFDNETQSTGTTAPTYRIRNAGYSNIGIAGYLAGGVSGGTFASYSQQNTGTVWQTTIDKLNYATESYSSISGLSTPSGASGAIQYSDAAGFSNSGVAGYIIGGSSQGASGNSTTVTVNKMTYSNDTVSNLTSVGGSGQPYFASGGAYIFSTNMRQLISNTGSSAYLHSSNAGSGASFGTFYKWTYSTDNYASIASTMSGIFSFGGVSSNGNTFGYYFNESGSQNTMYKLTFSNDTWASISTTLSAVRGTGVPGSNSTTAAYFAGGQASTSIDKVLYSNDTRSTLSATLGAIQDAGVAISNNAV